jgi:hypothetical protein
MALSKKQISTGFQNMNRDAGKTVSFLNIILRAWRIET